MNLNNQYHLTDDADNDMDNIYEYTINMFGEEQAFKYTSELYDLFQILSDREGIGIRISNSSYRRYSYKSHMIFFEKLKNGRTEIKAILHQSSKWISRFKKRI